MHLTSGVCVAYYVFPDGPSFPTKRSTTHWLATTHPQFLYQPSQVLWPHCMCRLVHGPQSSPQCQLGLIPKKLESPACQSRHARLWAVKPNLAPLNVGLSATPIIWHRTEVSTHTHTHTGLMALCLRLPGWAGTRKVKPVWILLMKRQWVAVASAGLYASLHQAPDR